MFLEEFVLLQQIKLIFWLTWKGFWTLELVAKNSKVDHTAACRRLRFFKLIVDFFYRTESVCFEDIGASYLEHLLSSAEFNKLLSSTLLWALLYACYNKSRLFREVGQIYSVLEREVCIILSNIFSLNSVLSGQEINFQNTTIYKGDPKIIQK